MNKLILLGLICLIVLSSGCVTTPIPNVEVFYYNDTNNMIENDKICYELCKQREIESSTYRCEYNTPECFEGVCKCYTW